MNKAIRFFACSNYVKDYRGIHPTQHYIREDALNEVVRLKLKRKLADMRTEAKNNDNFIRAVRRFMEMDTLTAPLLRELIDRIEVSVVEGKGKNRAQQIVIHYRFAGYIDLEENYVESNFKQDTRQGVAVEYVSHAAGE